jgi:hypothetical protein
MQGRAGTDRRGGALAAVCKPEPNTMFLAIAVILLILWLLGFLAFHITTAAIHIVLIIAIILVVLHFFRGRRGV